MAGRFGFPHSFGVKTRLLAGGYAHAGGVPERPNGAVLKTVDAKASRGFESHPRRGYEERRVTHGQFTIRVERLDHETLVLDGLALARGFFAGEGGWTVRPCSAHRSGSSSPT